MKSILQKTLLAATIAATFGANAGVISTNLFVSGTSMVPATISAEGLTLNDTVAGPAINLVAAATSAELGVYYRIQANHTDDTILTFQVSGATIANSSIGEISLDRVVTTSGTASQQSDFEPLSINVGAGTITFRGDATNGTNFNESSEGGVAAGAFNNDDALMDDTFVLGGLELDDITGPVVISATSIIAGLPDPIDTAAATTVASVASTVTVEVAANGAFDGEIDVTNSRLQFTDQNSNNTGFDEVTIDVESDGQINTPNVVEIEYAISGTGSNAFLLDDDGDLDATSLFAGAGTLNAGATAEIDEMDASVLLATFPADVAAGASGTQTIRFTAPTTADEDAPILEAQSFAAIATVDLDLGSSLGDVTVPFSLGAWTLSSASFEIPFMPYGTGINQIIHIANDSNVDGSIELTAFDDQGNEFGPVELSVTAAPNTVTRLGGPIAAALAEAEFSLSGNVYIQLDVNAASSALDVFAAYSVNGDRVAVGSTGS